MTGAENRTRSRRRQPLPPEERQVQQAQANVPNELMQAKLLRATMSERQLEEVLTDFWFNHFNVFVGKGQVRQYLTEYERDAIRPHVLGNFRDVLGADGAQPGDAVLSGQLPEPRRRTRAPRLPPDMQQRLNNPRARRRSSGSSSCSGSQQAPAAARRKRGLNENYARELMELHTLGVDGGYTQKDVIEVARDPHGLDDRSAAAGRRLRLPPADARRRARRPCSARRSTAGGEKRRRAAARHARDAPGDGASHRVQARAAVRRRRAAGGAGRSRGEEVPRHEGRPARGDARRSSRRRSSSPTTRIARR